MNDITVKNEKIENMIYKIRGKEVMLDSSLAKLYECTNGTKDINKAVKRNIEKFPEDFYFILTSEEYNQLEINNIKNNFSRFQNGTLNEKNNRRETNLKYLPYVFTEQGVAMLSSVLHTKVASRVSVDIMRAFVSMRKFISNNNDMFKKIVSVEYKMIEHDNKLDEIFERLDGKKEFKSKLFFNGEIYDSYSLLIDIIKEAKISITIIDNYLDKTILDILKYKNKSVEVILITDKVKNKLTALDIEKFNKEYSCVKKRYTNTFHDRFIIIDDKNLYHLGSSFKDLGIKVFAINKIEDKNIINLLNGKVSEKN